MLTTGAREDLTKNSPERQDLTTLSCFSGSLQNGAVLSNAHMQMLTFKQLSTIICTLFHSPLLCKSHLFHNVKLKADEIPWQKHRTSPNWSLKWINRNLTEMDWGFYQTWCSKTLIKSLPIRTYGVKFSTQIDLITKDEWSPLIMN